MDHLGGSRCIGAPSHAAYIEVMAKRPYGDTLPVVEPGLEYEQIIEVLSAAIRIVGDDHIVRSPGLSVHVPVQ